MSLNKDLESSAIRHKESLPTLVLTSTFVIQSKNAQADRLFGADINGRHITSLIQGPYRQRVSKILSRRSVLNSHFALKVPVQSNKPGPLVQKWILKLSTVGTWNLYCKPADSSLKSSKCDDLNWQLDKNLGFYQSIFDKKWLEYFNFPQYFTFSNWLSHVHPLDKRRVSRTFGAFLLKEELSLNCSYRMASVSGIEIAVLSTGQHLKDQGISAFKKYQISGVHKILGTKSQKVGDLDLNAQMVEDCEVLGIRVTGQSIDWIKLRSSRELVKKIISSVREHFHGRNLSLHIVSSSGLNTHCIACDETLLGEYIALEFSIDEFSFHQKHLKQMLLFGFQPRQIDHAIQPCLQSTVHLASGHLTIASVEGHLAYSIYLPLDTTTNKTAPIERVERQPHILVVDDHLMVLKFMQEILRHEGYNVTTISNSQSALTLFASSPNDFDLVITDLSMPGLKGGDLVRQVLECRKDTSVLVCSGDYSLSAREEANTAGANWYFSKPINIPSLLAICRSQFKGKFAIPRQNLA
ncbi:MAG: CheY-like chemotaxis protein [Candidatus Azotimanducaceae bacterium]|jgi:CheY-like chemotaxis protein